MPEDDAVAAAIQRAQDVVVVQARDVSSPHRSTTPARRGGSTRTPHRRTRDSASDGEPSSPVYDSSSRRSKKGGKTAVRRSPRSSTTGASTATQKAGSTLGLREEVVSPGSYTQRSNTPKQKEELSRLHRLISDEKSKRKSSRAKQKNDSSRTTVSATTDISVADLSETHSRNLGLENQSVASTNHSVTSNILYQALRTGNSSTLSQTRLPGNLNQTMSATSDNFRDFHNPNVIYDSDDGTTTTTRDTRSLTHRGPAAKQQRPLSPSEATTTATPFNAGQLPPKSLRSYDSSEEMAFYRFVSKHSILQLCTEDLMSDNWKLVDYALYRLAEVCCCSSENAGELKLASSNRIRFIKAGGHGLLVGVMKKYSQLPDIQVSSTRLIHQMTLLDREGDDTNNGAFAELFASVHGLECVIHAIEQFPGTRDGVHPHACAALTTLVCSSPKMVRRLMQDVNHLRVYFAAMRSESTGKEQIGTCRVLYLLSSQQEYCREILEAGGVEAIGLEMKNHLQEKVVQIFGCWALANIAEHTKSASPALRDVGSLAILMAMKTYPEEEKVQEKASIALFHLSLVAPQEIKKAGALSSLGSSLENFPESESIQQFASATIKRLLETPPSPSSKQELGSNS